MKHKLISQLIFIFIIVGVLLSSVAFSQESFSQSLSQETLVASVIPVIFHNTINSCESAGFEVQVANPFSEQDTYDFSITGVDSGFDNETLTSVITPSAVVLNPGESTSVSINLTLKDCTLTGRLPVLFVAGSRTFDDAVELELLLDLNAQGVPLIAPETSNILTNFSKNVAALSILNTGTEPARYGVQLVGEPWMRLGQSSLQLGAGEEKSLNLIFEPQEDVSEKKYNATVILTDLLTKKQFKKKLVVQLQSVPFAKKLLQNTLRFGSIIFLVVVVLLSLLKSYFWYASPEQKHARLVAAEMRAQARQADIETKKQVVLEKQKKIDDAAAKKSRLQEKLDKIKMKMQQQAEESLREKYYLVEKNAVIGASFSGKVLKCVVFLLAIIFVAGVVFSLRNLLKGNLPFVFGGLVLLFFVLMIHRFMQGRLKCKKFKLVVAGESAGFDVWKKGITRVELVPSVPVRNLLLKVRKSRCSAPKLVEKVYSYFTVTSNVDCAESVKVNASIPLRWVKNVDDILVWRWSGVEWLEIVPEMVRKTSNTVEVSASADVIGTFAVGVLMPKAKTAGKIRKTLGKTIKRAKKTTTPGFLGYVGLALLFVLAISAFTYFAPKEEINTTGIPRQSWPQDTDHLLNLSFFFHDPDGESLTFSASLVDSISVAIVGDAVQLSPAAGFVGEREVVFTATDSGNNSVQSNRVKLVVVKSYLPAWARPYMLNVVAGLGILLALFVLKRWKNSLRKFLEG